MADPVYFDLNTRRETARLGRIRILTPTDFNGAQLKNVGAGTEAGDVVIYEQLAGSLGMKKGTIQLNGVNPTHVLFQADAAAYLLSDAVGSGFAIGHAATLIIAADGGADKTYTSVATAGYLTAGASPSTDISGGSDDRFYVAINGGTPQLITLTLAGLNSGAAIAAAIQAAIRAIGTAPYTTVTCTYDAGSNGTYVITSPTLGTVSAVAVTSGGTYDVAAELKLLTANGGVATAGTGHFANAALATVDELVAAINGVTAFAAVMTASKVGTGLTAKLKISSKTTGRTSKLIVNSSSTIDTIINMTGTETGYIGLGYTADMADALYQVLATIYGDSDVSVKGISIANKATTGFDVYAETAADTAYVDLLAIAAE